MEALLLSVSLNMKNKTQTKQQKLVASLLLLMGLGCLGIMQTIFSFFSSPRAKFYLIAIKMREMNIVIYPY